MKVLSGFSERITKFLLKSPDGLGRDYARFYIAARLTYPFGVMGHAGFIFIFWHLELVVLAVFNIFSVAIFMFAAMQSNRGNMRLPSLLTMILEIPGLFNANYMKR